MHEATTEELVIPEAIIDTMEDLLTDGTRTDDEIQMCVDLTVGHVTELVERLKTVYGQLTRAMIEYAAVQGLGL